MAHNGIAKIQHYVPQFLLRNFGIGKKNQIYVFDKRTGHSFIRNVNKVAAESHFYDFEFEGKTLTLEPELSKLESKTGPLFQGILDEDSLAFLTSEDRVLLATFFPFNSRALVGLANNGVPLSPYWAIRYEAWLRARTP